MKLKDLFQACQKIASIRLRQHPDSKIKVGDDPIRLDQLVKELETLESWCYNGELDVERVVRCRNCRHYKRYKHKSAKNPRKHEIIHACECDKIQRKPEYYCARGEER